MACKSWGIHVASQLSPDWILLSCMFWLSLGVNQTKLVPACTAAMTSGVSPETMLPPAGLGDSRRNALWSAPRLPFCMIFHVFPALLTRSRIEDGGIVFRAPS